MKKLKKIILPIVSAALALCLFGCSDTDTPVSEKNPAPVTPPASDQAVKLMLEDGDAGYVFGSFSEKCKKGATATLKLKRLEGEEYVVIADGEIVHINSAASTDEYAVYNIKTGDADVSIDVNRYSVSGAFEERWTAVSEYFVKNPAAEYFEVKAYYGQFATVTGSISSEMDIFLMGTDAKTATPESEVFGDVEFLYGENERIMVLASDIGLVTLDDERLAERLMLPGQLTVIGNRHYAKNSALYSGGYALKLNLTPEDHTILKSDVKPYYKAGETVKIEVISLTDVEVRIFANGEEVWSSSRNSEAFLLVMPEEDVTVEIKY